MCIFCDGEVVTDKQVVEVKCDKVTHVSVRIVYVSLCATSKIILRIIDCPNLQYVKYRSATHGSLWIINSRIPDILDIPYIMFYLVSCNDDKKLNLVNPLHTLILRNSTVLPVINHCVSMFRLIIDNCPIRDLSDYVLPPLEHLVVKHCNSLLALPREFSVEDADIRNCKLLQSLPSTADAENFNLSNCPCLITEIVENGGYIFDCSWVHEIDKNTKQFLENIEKLKVIQRAVRKRVLKRRCARRFYLKVNNFYHDLIKTIELY